jgi:hypothetical protein
MGIANIGILKYVKVALFQCALSFIIARIKNSQAMMRNRLQHHRTEYFEPLRDMRIQLKQFRFILHYLKGILPQKQDAINQKLV